MSDGTTITEEHLREDRRTVETILGGVIGGGVIALAGAILAIVGLTGMEPRWLLGAATIAVGISFLIEGAAIASRLGELLHETTEGRVQMSELGAGVTGETLAGVTGIVLGILGILNVAPLSLLPIAALIYGAALILGAGANVRISEITIAHREEAHPMTRHVIRQAVLATTGFQILVGLGAVTLGIIALAQVYPFTVSLVAMLLIAASFLLSNAALAGRMTTVLRRF